MKICLITPTAHVKMTELLEGRFCLANEAIRSKQYRDYFRCEADKGHQVILDNGVFEGDLVTDQILVELTKDINPPVLIVPDTINAPWKENYDRAIAFADQYKINLREQELMFVVQTISGDGDGFWIAIETWLRDRRFRWLGICRDACRNAFGQYTSTDDQELNRFYFLSEFARRGYLEEFKRQGKRMHFLGLGDNIWLLQYAWFVESVDTASLFWRAAEWGHLLPASGKFYQVSNGRPYNYMQQDYEAFFTRYGDKAAFQNYWRKLVVHNCVRAHSWVRKANQLQKQKTLNARI